MKLKDLSIRQLEKRMSLAGIKMSKIGVEMSEIGIILNEKKEKKK